MTESESPVGGTPFVVRLVAGDIIDAQASMIVVNHFNDVPPGGAEGAVDAVLGGAITRRAVAGALRGRFGTAHFLPTLSSPLAAGCVCVVCLGDPERFTKDRLAELGAAIVEAAATIGVRDAATILHGAGMLHIEPEEAARELLTGLMRGIERIPGGRSLRELAIVEHDPASFERLEQGLTHAMASPRVHVYVEHARIKPRVVSRQEGDGSLPAHLRLGVTRSGGDLKVTVISADQPYDCSATPEYPVKFTDRLYARLEREILREEDSGKRLHAMQSLGSELFENFLSEPNVGVAGRVEKAPNATIVLRLDDATVNFPWELLRVDGRFIAREKVIGRQVELETIGRQSAWAPPHSTLQVLVVGNPTGDLDGARLEAVAVADMLSKEAGANVTTLIGDQNRRIDYGEVSAALAQNNFDVLHYAGHATYDELREGHSGLQLAGRDVLTADDLATRNSIPRLVVANACSSAKTGQAGFDDGFMAAQRSRDMVASLLRAGTRAFLGTQWPVDDDAAKTFALSFYEHLLARDENNHRLPIGEAVRRARVAVVEAHGESCRDWAAYSLYGSPWKPAL